MSVLRLTRRITVNGTFLVAFLATATLILVTKSSLANAPPPRVERSEELPAKLGKFERFGFARRIEPRDRDGLPRDYLLSLTGADYGFNGDSSFHVELFKWENSSAAYADLTSQRKREGQNRGFIGEPIGTLSAPASS